MDPILILSTLVMTMIRFDDGDRTVDGGSGDCGASGGDGDDGVDR